MRPLLNLKREKYLLLKLSLNSHIHTQGSNASAKMRSLVRYMSRNASRAMWHALPHGTARGAQKVSLTINFGRHFNLPECQTSEKIKNNKMTFCPKFILGTREIR
jgi:hypothetical protein